MKRSCIRRLSFAIAIGMLVLGSAMAQEQPYMHAEEFFFNPTKEPRTKLEAMMQQTGTVVSIKSSRMDEYRGVYCIEITDVFTGKREIGIGLALEYSRKEINTVIDYDEIESLLRGIDYISKVTNSTDPSEFHGIYQTKENFIISYYLSNKGWSIRGTKLLRNNEYSWDDLSETRIDEFRTAIFQAKQELDKIK